MTGFCNGKRSLFIARCEINLLNTKQDKFSLQGVKANHKFYFYRIITGVENGRGTWQVLGRKEA